MRLQIIKELEDRYAPAPSGQYYWCSDGKFHLDHISFSLLQYDTGVLEIMLEESMSQEEYERWYNDQQKELARVAG